MGGIVANAIFHIAAEAAWNCQGDLFMERDPLSSELFHVNDYERSGMPRRS